MVKQIQRYVLSYCEIPQELTEHTWLQEYQCDCYVPYKLPEPNQYLDPEDYELGLWILSNYPDLIGQEILIHIDY